MNEKLVSYRENLARPKATLLFEQPQKIPEKKLEVFLEKVLELFPDLCTEHFVISEFESFLQQIRN